MAGSRDNIPFFSKNSFNKVSVTDYGADNTGATSSQTAFLNAIASGAKIITIPDGIYNIGTLSINSSVTLMGNRMPIYDGTADELQEGAILKGIISSGYPVENVKIINLGLDSTGETEGLVFVGSVGVAPMKGIHLENFIVLGDAVANHCALIEFADELTIKNIKTVKGVQGLAIKATNFTIEGSEHADTTAGGLVLRYTPNIPCENGTISNVRIRAINNAKAGGIDLVNSEQGATLRNISIDQIIVENGLFALYYNNAVNTVSMDNVHVSNLTVRDTNGFAVQVFGPVKACSLNGYRVIGTAGSLIINDSTCEEMTFSNFQIDGGVPALLKGDGHIVHDWRRIGTSPSFLIDNQSTNLQISSMDQTASISSSLGGTVSFDDRKITLDKLYEPTISQTANGALAAQEYNLRKGVKITPGVMAQNDTATLLTYSTSQRAVEITLKVQSQAGFHIQKLFVTNNDITLIAKNASAQAVFTLVNNGNNIDFKYLFVTTGDVYVSAVYTEYVNV